ncbi:sensor histidine kinase [Streptomyces venezuelae]|uniref:sensor histidine kinase n=1 Tax=Streptomyces venezuelae TaxID=54571 RepID=UPI001CC25546|nr:sensor histidine kinase [Streptomyces venezuelae]
MIDNVRVPATTRTGGWAERVLAAVHRDPVSAPRRQRTDALLAVGAGALSLLIALTLNGGREPDALGLALLVAAAVPLAWRRRAPLLTLLAVAAFEGPYHILDNPDQGPVAQSVIALWTVGATGSMLRTVLTGLAGVAVALALMLAGHMDSGREILEVCGWILAILFLGQDIRIYRRYVATLVERAERAERTREEEAARRVAEERLRIARDLHDLLAHSITLIGVQTSVAAHVLRADPDRLDREAVAQALADISATCREARTELRGTLEVLRADSGSPSPPAGADGPLPGLDAVPSLVRAAETAGARVALTLRTPPSGPPPAVGAAAYRIVQEALTNAVRHAGPAVGIAVVVEPLADGRELRVGIADDGPGPRPQSGPPGFGIIGMRERARSTGGTLTAGPGPDGGFTVEAVLPLYGAGDRGQTARRAQDEETVT